MTSDQRKGRQTSEPFQRLPVVLEIAETPAFTEVYGFAGSTGIVALEGQLLKRAESANSTVFLFMHPTSVLHLLPMPRALAMAGMDVLCCASRYPRNDTALIMEKVVADLAAWMRWAREEAGYQKVVLVGWSGGGSLSLLYQAEAEDPQIRATPAGDPVDIVSLQPPKADGVVFIAAHLSRAETMTEWLDPSVIDELDPNRRLRKFDIYAEDPLFRAPYPRDFIAEFRAAQVARNRKITAWCQEMLLQLRRGGLERERAFVTHRTMCDPRWLDGTLDPNDRRLGWCYMGDPRTVNVGTTGLARYSSLRSWLSQWSVDLSVAVSMRNAPRVKSVPVLLIENSADDAVPATHNPKVYVALGTPNKRHVVLPKATHYYLGQPELLQQCLNEIHMWVAQNNLA